MHTWKWQSCSYDSSHLFSIIVQCCSLNLKKKKRERKKRGDKDNSAYIFACETRVLPIWWVAWLCSVRWIQTQVFSLAAKLDVPGSAPGPAPARCLQINIQSTGCSGWDLHPTPSSGRVLYSLATSRAAPSWQTRKRSKRFTHLPLPHPHIGVDCHH